MTSYIPRMSTPVVLRGPLQKYAFYPYGYGMGGMYNQVGSGIYNQHNYGYPYMAGVGTGWASPMMGHNYNTIMRNPMGLYNPYA